MPNQQKLEVEFYGLVRRPACCYLPDRKASPPSGSY